MVRQMDNGCVVYAGYCKWFRRGGRLLSERTLVDNPINKPKAAGAMAYLKFDFNGVITPEHQAFFDKYGFIHFRNFLTPQGVEEIIDAAEQVQSDWIAKGITKVNGTPIRYGLDDTGKQIVHRFAFLNQYSTPVQKLISGNSFEALKNLLAQPDKARIGYKEKDGAVLNHYVNAQGSNFLEMGWHTDGARDIFYGLGVQPLLNVGLYLDDSPKAKGGLRVIPGSHKQGFWSLLFRKRYFVDHTEDEGEVVIEAKAGDLVIHHGSIWHRVAASSFVGSESRRRVMYVPIVTGKYMPKTSTSKTPVYHHFSSLVGRRKNPHEIPSPERWVL